jgi:hypothetical protein
MALVVSNNPGAASSLVAASNPAGTIIPVRVAGPHSYQFPERHITVLAEFFKNLALPVAGLGPMTVAHWPRIATWFATTNLLASVPVGIALAATAIAIPVFSLGAAVYQCNDLEDRHRALLFNGDRARVCGMQQAASAILRELGGQAPSFTDIDAAIKKAENEIERWQRDRRLESSYDRIVLANMQLIYDRECDKYKHLMEAVSQAVARTKSSEVPALRSRVAELEAQVANAEKLATELTRIKDAFSAQRFQSKLDELQAVQMLANHIISQLGCEPPNFDQENMQIADTQRDLEEARKKIEEGPGYRDIINRCECVLERLESTKFDKLQKCISNAVIKRNSDMNLLQGRVSALESDLQEQLSVNQRLATQLKDQKENLEKVQAELAEQQRQFEQRINQQVEEKIAAQFAKLQQLSSLQREVQSADGAKPVSIPGQDQQADTPDNSQLKDAELMGSGSTR